MVLILSALLASLSLAFAAVDYTSKNCNAHLPACLSYDDGCNMCACDMSTGSMLCTLRQCFWQGVPSCQHCEAGSFWLAFDTFQSNGYPTCWSAFLNMGVAHSFELNSKCACPVSHPYYVRGVGCVNWGYCLSFFGNAQAPRIETADVFVLPALDSSMSSCPYTYQTCTSSQQCAPGFVCNVPASNYETCIPLLATMDDQCHPIAQSIDCMGTGFGYCHLDVTEAPLTTTTSAAPINTPTCEIGGCSSQICAENARKLVSTCEYRCEYGCHRFQVCSRNPEGQCQWQTNADSQIEYQTCVQECTGLIPPMLPPTALPPTALPPPSNVQLPLVIAAPARGTDTCAYCRSPVSGNCEFFVGCGPEDLCSEPCQAYPDAKCLSSNCGGCAAYFVHPTDGRVITMQECNNNSATPAVPVRPSFCDAVMCVDPCATKCRGCTAATMECSVLPCASSSCCGCAHYALNGRDMTGICYRPEMACMCLPGGTPQCCQGQQFQSECEAGCGSCYDLQLDCTPGLCTQ